MAVVDTGTDQHSEATQESTVFYRYYVLIVLTLTYASSYMDRQIVSILIEDIKMEFALSDTQLGLLSGLAFALFYSVLGIPIARFADRHSRTKIITVAISIWSVVTVACGAVSSFVQLFIARMGVGVGEAGGLAPAHSLISDYFSADRRSIALSIYSLGIVVGMMAGLLLGGYVAENYGWRWAFVVAGGPGVILALLMFFTVKEPKRGVLDQGKFDDEQKESLGFVESAKLLFANQGYLYALIGHVAGVFFAYAMVTWLPALFMRQFELGQTAVGGVVSLIFFSGAVPGMLAGGYLSDWLGKNYSPKWRGYVPAIGCALCIPFFFLAFLSSSMQVAVVFFCLGNLFLSLHHAPGLAIVQIVVDPKNRAFAVALVYFFSNMIGLALGPLYVGGVSDAVQDTFGAQSLGIAMMTLLASLLVAVWGYWRAGKVL